MKRNFIGFVILVTLMLCSCSKETISGSGNLVSEDRSVIDFTTVSVEGTFNLTVTQGEEQGVHIMTDDNVIGHVKTEVENGVLKLYLESGINYKNIDLVVAISSVNLNGLKNQGSSTIAITTGDDNELFYVTNEGSGNIEFSGASQELIINNEGSGRLSGFLFTVSKCTIGIIGSGNVEISCTEEMDVTIEGSGNVLYKGTPTITANIEGSGKVVNRN